VVNWGRGEGGVSVIALGSFQRMGSDVLIGVVKGFVSGFKNLIAPTNQTQQQQQQMMANPMQMQQPNATNPAGTFITTSPTPILPSATSNQLPPGTPQHPLNLTSPANGDDSNQDDNKQLGPFNGAYAILPSPAHPTSPGSSVLQIASKANLDPPQATLNTVWSGTNLPSHSASSLGHKSEPDASNTDALLGSYPDREPSENGGGEADSDDFIMGDVDVQSVESFVYPPSIPTSEAIGTCRLEGCSNPAYVDSITDLESEYCSRKHQE
jgi:hypothetical protein